MTSSIAAIITGYQRFQPDINISAVILNNVSGSRHERKLMAAVEQYCEIPVVGSIPRDPNLRITERHLGLIPFPEAAKQEAIIEYICRKLESKLDLETILAIARSFQVDFKTCPADFRRETSSVRIGVIMDRVFNFYYPENLEALGRAGAELVFINSLRDRLPEIDGLYIGGGFPEFFLEELEANRELRWDIADSIEDGLPVYAECAGLLYLCQSIRWNGERHEMIGVIPSEVEICQLPQGHGYVVAEVVEDNPLFPVGLTLRGHEFHHARLSMPNGLSSVYKIKRGHGIDGDVDGILYKNVFASYTHLHALGTPQWAEAFVSLASRELRPLGKRQEVKVNSI
jgi:cobyrinic acid a,c-diamide synthase